MDPQKAKEKKVVLTQAIAKRWIAVRKYSKLRKRNDRRNRVAKELLTTEVTYVAGLQALQKVYLKPISDLLDSGAITQLLNSIPTEEEIRSVRGNFELILGVNQKFLAELDQRMNGQKWTPHTKLADILLQYVPFFKMYTEYVSNYNTATTTLDQLRQKYPLVNDIYLEGQTKIAPDGRMYLTMESYLIMPVQRMPRYKLLLEELVCFTWEEHPDFHSLCKAVKLVHDVNTHIDRSVAMQDSRFQVFNIQNKLAGECGGELVQPHRVWIADAEMQLVTMNGQDGAWICLFNDILILATRVLLSYKFSARLLLEKTLVVPLPDSSHYKNVFQLVHDDDCFTLVASDADQKAKWIAQINAAIELIVAAQPHLAVAREVAERKRSQTAESSDTDRKIAVALVRSEYRSQDREMVAAMTITERKQLFEMGLMKQQPEQQRSTQLAKEIRLVTKGLAAQKRLEWESFHRSRVLVPPPQTSPSSHQRSPSASNRTASPSVRGRAPSNPTTPATLPPAASPSSLAPPKSSPLAVTVVVDPAAAARIGTATASPKRDSRAEAALISPGTVQQKKAVFQPNPSSLKNTSSPRETETTPLLGGRSVNGEEKTTTPKDRSCDCIIL